MRQRPGTSSGVVFMTLEDETGVANIIVWPKVFDRFRPLVMTSRCLRVEGKVQREGPVIHLIADHLTDLTPLLHTLGGGGMEVASRDFH